MIESPPVTTKVYPVTPGFYRLFSRMALPLILALQAVISLIELRNTAFQDEALYLLAGRQIFLSWMGKTSYVEPYGLYFSGYPSFYPVIGGLLDTAGGLEAARLLSLLCMLIVTISVYFMTLEFFERRSALAAALLFACEGSVLFIGRLATYDAMCLGLLAVAILLSIRASKANSAQASLLIGPALLLAVTAKYAGLLFVPSILAMFAWWTWKQKNLEEMLIRMGFALFSLVVPGAITFYNLDPEVLTGLGFTTTNRVSFNMTPPFQVIGHIAMMEGLFFGLALLGLVLYRKRSLLVGLILFGSALLVPLYHTYKGELISLDKHLAFSMYFLAPLAGFFLIALMGWLQKRFARLPWYTVFLLCLLTLPMGLQESLKLYSAWPSSTPLTEYLRPRVHLAWGHYLEEDFDVSRYYLQRETAIWQWTSLDYFVYTDKEKHDLSGETAYKAAVQEGYFDMIELSYGYHTYLATQISETVVASHHYQLLGKIPFHDSYGMGYYWIWGKTTG